MKQFLDINPRIQIVHLSENLMNAIDLSQYKNIKTIKYFMLDIKLRNFWKNLKLTVNSLESIKFPANFPLGRIQ